MCLYAVAVRWDFELAWYFKSKTALPRPPRDAHVPREPGLGQPARLVELEARAREGGGGVGGAGLLDAGQPIGKAERDARRAGGGARSSTHARSSASPDSGGR